MAPGTLTLLPEGQNVNANTYLFRAGAHPGATRHALVADAAFDLVVPEFAGTMPA
jgi:phospholipase/lecithinase/hemolysin